MAIELNAILDPRRSLAEDALRAGLQLIESAPARLKEAMAYSLLAPGKRLRPILVMLACEACGGRFADAAAAGAAVEMVHTYSLVHDDLPAMDDDDLRRGLPTCHVKFGEALAILAGDALLTLAFEVLTVSYPPAVAAACCRELAVGAGAAGMVGGQVADLAAEGRIAPGEGAPAVGSLIELEGIHLRKTGALFRACLRMGYAVAPETKSRLDAPLDRLDTFGRAFGLAFQITDDLLDVEGNSGTTGKRVNKDAARGKLTYPGLLGVAESRGRAEQLCRQAEDALRPFGETAEPLIGLARFLLERDR